MTFLFKFIILGLLPLKFYCSSAANSQQAVETAVFGKETFLVLILRYISNKLEVREVSKKFKACFEEATKYEVIDFDHRLGSLLSIPNDSFYIPAPILLMKLIKEFIGPFLKEIKPSLDSQFPEVQISVGKRVTRSKNRRIRSDSRRFVTLLIQFIDNTFFNPSIPQDQRPSPQRLLTFYRVISDIFSQMDFNTEVVPLLHFPIEELLLNAARGIYPDTVNYNLLFKHSALLPKKSIFEAFKATRLDLVAFILTLSDAHQMVMLRDEQLRWPLHYAAHFGDMDLLRTIYESGHSRIVHKVDRKNEKAIHKAASSGHLEAFKYLHQKGSIIAHSRTCKSPIINAIKNGHIQIVRYILTETNFLSIDNCALNYELLEMAIDKNNLDMLRLLRNSPRLYFSEEQIQRLVSYSGRSSFPHNYNERRFARVLFFS